MKKLLAVVVSILITSTTFSQGNYQQLLIYKANQNWEKLIKEAEKYTVRGSTHKDPAPYYYLAYGLYQMSFKANRDEKYSNAFKDAFTAISKMIRFDEYGTVVQKHEDFIDELKLSLLEIVRNDIDVKQYRRAFGWAMRYYKFGRHYIPALILDGGLRLRKNDRVTARMKWQLGRELLKKADVPSWSDADKKVFQLGLVTSAKALKEDLQQKEAKKMMNLGQPYFEGQDRWDALYDEVVN